MIALLRAELRRFTSRRLMRILAIGSLALLVIVIGRVAMVHSDRVVEVSGEQFAEEQRLACEDAKARGHAPPDIDCSSIGFEGGSYTIDDRLHGSTALPAAALAVAIAVGLLAFPVAASFVGADWHAGTLQALLFWEPRRGRVLFAKAVALVAGLVAFFLVLEAVAYAGIYLVAATRGTTENVTSGLHQANLLLVLRGALFVSIVALLGYAIAGLARITGAALGVAFVYFAIVENVVGGLRPGWERFLVTRNIVAVLAKEVQVSPAHPRRGDHFGFGPDELFVLTGVRGAVTLAVYLAVLLGAYYVVFTRRDVT